MKIHPSHRASLYIYPGVMVKWIPTRRIQSTPHESCLQGIQKDKYSFQFEYQRSKFCRFFFSFFLFFFSSIRDIYFGGLEAETYIEQQPKYLLWNDKNQVFSLCGGLRVAWTFVCVFRLVSFRVVGKKMLGIQCNSRKFADEISGMSYQVYQGKVNLIHCTPIYSNITI